MIVDFRQESIRVSVADWLELGIVTLLCKCPRAFGSSNVTKNAKIESK